MNTKVVFYTEDMDSIRVPFTQYPSPSTMHLVALTVANNIIGAHLPTPAYVEVQELGTQALVSLWSVKVDHVNPHSTASGSCYTHGSYAVACGTQRGAYGTRVTLNRV